MKKFISSTLRVEQKWFVELLERKVFQSRNSRIDFSQLPDGTFPVWYSLKEQYRAWRRLPFGMSSHGLASKRHGMRLFLLARLQNEIEHLTPKSRHSSSPLHEVGRRSRSRSRALRQLTILYPPAALNRHHRTELGRTSLEEQQAKIRRCKIRGLHLRTRRPRRSPELRRVRTRKRRRVSRRKPHPCVPAAPTPTLK